MYEVGYVAVIPVSLKEFNDEKKERVVLELPDDAIITHMAVHYEGIALSEVVVRMIFHYSDGAQGRLEKTFISRRGLVQDKEITAFDLVEAIFNSIESNLKAGMPPQRKKIIKIEAMAKGDPEDVNDLTLYVRAYTNKEDYPYYLIVNIEGRSFKYSPYIKTEDVEKYKQIIQQFKGQVELLPMTHKETKQTIYRVIYPTI